MTRSALACVLAVGLAGLARGDDKALKALEGTYKVTVAEQSGKAAEKAITDVMTVTIASDQFTVSAGPDDKKAAKITVMPAAKVSTIDLSPADGPEKGKTFAGIYRKVENGELTLVFREGGNRPTEFKSDDGATLLRLKKVEK